MKYICLRTVQSATYYEKQTTNHWRHSASHSHAPRERQAAALIH